MNNVMANIGSCNCVVRKAIYVYSLTTRVNESSYDIIYDSSEVKYISSFLLSYRIPELHTLVIYFLNLIYLYHFTVCMYINMDMRQLSNV